MTPILRLLALFALALLSCTPAYAQSNTNDVTLLDLGAVPTTSFPPLDLGLLADEDALRDLDPGVPNRFAVPRKLSLSTHEDGLWSQVGDEWVWQYRIAAKGAVHLNFGFDQAVLPSGARLTIFGVQSGKHLGPYSASDIPPHGQLWTAVLDGEEAILQVRVPAALRDQVNLHLVQVAQGYRGFGYRSKACKSGSCNTDVACLSPNDPWNNPRRAVGAYTVGGTATCTGSLLNNTANDHRMLFVTATHCGLTSDSVVQTMVVYWNYESPTCRVPGSAASGNPVARPSTTLQGLHFLAATNNPFGGGGAANTRSDFTLVELVTPPAGNDFNLYWAGWDRSPPPTSCAAPSNPASTVGLCAGIHHPNVDEKRITFVEQDMTLSGISNAQDTHWRANWDPTPPELPNISPMPASLPPSVTEPGSSGSPLYNAQQRLVGVLSGGASYCGASSADLNDDYGGLFAAWSTMAPFLDPQGTAPNLIDGINACTAPATPTGLTATASGPNQISLSWNAVAGAERYRVLRAMGGCPGTDYVQVAEVTATSYADTSVSGGSTYSYRVVTWDDGEQCPSMQSSCSSATATGTCALPPSFAGLASAASAGTSQCGISLAWQAATANCGTAADLRYNVYRSTSANFTPDSSTLLASCVTGTSLVDGNIIAPGAALHYLVRAEDISGQPASGQCGGVEETNLAYLSAAAFGPDTVSFQDDVESGGSPWQADGSGSVGANFAIATTDAASPTHSWFVPDPSGRSDRRLGMVQSITLPAVSNAVLSFAHRHDLENGYDGAVLEYSIDGGSTWVDILEASGSVPANTARIIANGYTNAISSSFNNAIGGRQAWTGSSSGFVTTEVDLSDFAGQTVQFRFRFASDSSVAGTGWWIDDVRVSQGSACSLGDLIFKDGFEP